MDKKTLIFIAKRYYKSYNTYRCKLLKIRLNTIDLGIVTVLFKNLEGTIYSDKHVYATLYVKLSSDGVPLVLNANLIKILTRKEAYEYI